jgi:glycosyltransferase involved in cell wall biosynthesis
MRRAAASVSLRPLRTLERKVVQRASAVFATSDATREQLAAVGRRADIGLLRIPVDVGHFTPAPDAAWRESLNHPTAVFIGRADDPRKNVALVFEAARRLPSVRFVLAGTPPPDTHSLPSNITALGPVSDTAEVLRSGTVFVLPSLQEGFGIVAAEALACGLPVLTTPSGGPEDLVRRSGAGVVTETFDAEEFADRLRQLIRDDDALNEFRRKGRAYVEREHAPDVFQSALREALVGVGT